MARVLSLFRLQPFLALVGRRKVGLCKMSMDSRARQVFASALEAVQPDTVVHRSIERHKDDVLIDGHKYTLKHNLHLVGFGKAVLGMAAEVERIMGDHLVRGVISVPRGIQETLQQHGKDHLLLNKNSCIKVMEGAKNNLPDADAMKAAQEIQQLASELTEKDLLLVLISGGGSALLPAPIPPITLEEKADVTRRLAAAGATIQELNTVRRALSSLKGGGLVRHAQPAQVVALILSDVIGDPLDLIASGPTVYSEMRFKETLCVLERYNFLNSLPDSVKDVFAIPDHHWKKNKGPSRSSENIVNVVIGSNSLALKCASRRARELGFRPVVLSPGVCGNVKDVARLYGLMANFASFQDEAPPEIAAELLKLGPLVGVESWDLHRTMQVLDEARAEGWGATCLLAGGEPTVELTGKGRGGRNQELAMRVAVELKTQKLPPRGPVFLSGGTDGQDGPTEAAGAVIDGGLWNEAQAQGLDINKFLENNDSYTFFSQLSDGKHLLVPGQTCTNVMDVHLLLIPTVPITVKAAQLES